MSHYTVLVLGDDVEAQLAPYDENISVAPRRRYIDDEDLERARAHYREKAASGELKEGADPEKPETYWEDWSGQPLRFDQVGNPYTLTTYNEASKWDWYAIGGRWAGSLILKPGATAVAKPNLSGWTWEDVSDEEKAKLSERADQAYKGDVDIDRMRQAAEDQAGTEWDLVHAAIKDLPAATSWDDFVARARAEEITWDEARKGYHEQPRVKAFAAVGVGGFMGPGLEEYEIERDLYVYRARLQAVPGFATLHFGEWFEPGHMGWFASTDATAETRQTYGEVVNKFIDDAADDVLFSMVDCHI